MVSNMLFRLKAHKNNQNKQRRHTQRALAQKKKQPCRALDLMASDNLNLNAFGPSDEGKKEIKQKEGADPAALAENTPTGYFLSS